MGLKPYFSLEKYKRWCKAMQIKYPTTGSSWAESCDGKQVINHVVYADNVEYGIADAWVVWK